MKEKRAIGVMTSSGPLFVISLAIIEKRQHAAAQSHGSRKEQHVSYIFFIVYPKICVCNLFDK